MSGPAATADAVFGGSIPEIYDRLLVPVFFEPYAEDLARRVAALRPRDVLELAAGTGVAARAMARSLPGGVRLVATDLNEPMLARAAAVGAARAVEWRRADALALPFADGSFDAIACQFGVMFFPDVRRGLAEARRVLRPGGTLLFTVWDGLEENEFADAVTAELARVFPADPPRFLARTPHGYHHREVIARDLAAAGFGPPPEIETVTARSRAPSHEVPAVGFCQGTPLRAEIEARAGATLAEATRACAEAMGSRFGRGPVEGRMQALLVTVRA